jgi:cyclic beta-1,2-glucan synthetase
VVYRDHRHPPAALGDEPSLWCVHVVDAGKRARRAGELRDGPRALPRPGLHPRDPPRSAATGPLSGTTGAVLDPIFALRTRVRLEPGQSASVAFTTLVATTRERAFELASRYHDPHAAQRALDLAWTSQQVELRELASRPPTPRSSRSWPASSLSQRRAAGAQEELRRNRGSQPLLWERHLGRLADRAGDHRSAGRAADAAAALRRPPLLAPPRDEVDLVVVNAQPSSYLQELHDRISEAMFARTTRRSTGRAASSSAGATSSARTRCSCCGHGAPRLRATAALATLLDERRRRVRGGDAEDPPAAAAGLEQASAAAGRARAGTRWPDECASAPPAPVPGPPPPVRTCSRDGTGAALDNGIGGLTADGDYQIRVQGDLAAAGALVERRRQPARRVRGHRARRRLHLGREQLLLPAHPLAQRPGQRPRHRGALPARRGDGELWSATPAPVRRTSPTPSGTAPAARSSSASTQGIATRLTLAMAEGEAVKLSVLRVTNRDSRPRRISVTAYAEWTLGVQREHTQHQVRTRFDRSWGRSSRATLRSAVRRVGRLSRR